MGGFGSGRKNWGDAKPTTGDLLKLKISAFVKKGLIGKDLMRSGGWHWTYTRTGEAAGNIGYEVNTLYGESYIRLHYVHGEQKEQLDYKVRLVTTTPHYGGVRWWFECPSVKCRRKVSSLYGGKYFLCRHCQHLSYRSQNLSDEDRFCGRAFALAEEMNAIGDCLDGFYAVKPKGMHQKTFDRKMARIENYRSRGMSLANPIFLRFIHKEFF
jgi:hypothetical protein